MTKLIPHPLALPRPLRKGDTIRFVSPASTPDREAVAESAALLESWGYRVDFGAHAFERLNYLAGTDEQRLADLDDALRDPSVRAIFATRGGKGSYRIADRLDFAAALRDPKFLVGFSDITALHLALLSNGVGGAIHGALQGDERDTQMMDGTTPLRQILAGQRSSVIAADDAEAATLALSTRGVASGLLIGGNLDMIATAAGWALPRLDGAIVLIEAVNMYLGQVDRHLSMLIKAGHFDGIAGIALGQFTDFKTSGTLTITELLREHLAGLGVPILGGLPLGHGAGAKCVLLGEPATLDADRRELRLGSAD